MFLWAFAFWHSAGTTTPQWLLRAQAACFGRTESGLPDIQGWLMLTLAPLLLLVTFIIAFYREVAWGFRAGAYSTPPIRFVLTVLLGGCILESIWVGGRIGAGLAVSSTNFQSTDLTSLPENYPVLEREFPQFTLFDQNNQELSLESFRGRTVLITFAFAHCRTICPALITAATRAQRRLGVKSSTLLIFSLDPWRDTVSSLPSIASTWKLEAGEHLLSGSPPEVSRVIVEFGVPTERDSKTGDVIHPGIIYVIDSEQKYAYLFSNPTPDWIVQAAKRLELRAKLSEPGSTTEPAVDRSGSPA